MSAVAAATVLSVANAPAFADTVTTGAIAGTITQAADGAAAAGVCAVVYRASNTNAVVAVGCSDATGHFAVTDLSVGQYLVEYLDKDTTRHDIPQWNAGKATSDTADIIRVNAGATTDNVNAAMVAGGWITGQAPADSDGQSDCVYVYDADDNYVPNDVLTTYDGEDSSSYGVSSSVCPDDDGVYVTSGLPAGSYRLRSASSSPTPWFSGKPSFDTADPVVVTTGAATDANFPGQAEASGTVSGTVVNDSGPEAGAQVTFQSSNTYSSVETSDDGTYSTTLAPGSYTVQFSPAPDDSQNQSQYYQDAARAADASSVTVTSGGVLTGISAHLHPGGTIAGTVVDSSGKPVTDFAVVACLEADFVRYSSPSCNSYDHSTVTGDDGTYSLTGLAPGSYVVTFSADGNDTVGYLSQLYRGTVATADASFTPVPVTAGETATGIDDTVSRGAQITGRVTDATTGQPVSDICVDARPTSTSDDDGDDDGYYADTVCTGDDGSYTTEGLASGTYYLDFSNNRGRYIEQYYDNAADQDSAKPVTVTASTTYTGYDAAMQLGGNIAGKVTDSSGAPLSGVCVELYPAGSATGREAGCTGQDGTYSTSSVPSGDYRVQFVDDSGDHTNEYYDNSATLSDAKTVTVAVGKTTPGIDASLTGAELPGAPSNVVATAADAAATVTFDAPSSDGGSAITGYTITPSPACDDCTGLTSSSTSTTVRGLTNGTSYTFTVAATNGLGTGDDSTASNAVTPTATQTGGGGTGGGGGTTPVVSPPGAPTNISARANVSDVTVSYAAPASDGNAPISSYQVTASPACASCTGLTSTGTRTVVHGLSTGVTYTFTVTAVNAIGPGPASVASNAVIPTAAATDPVSRTTTDPGAPATVSSDGTTATASGGTGTVTVAQYPSNPAATPTFDPTGAYLDVSTSAGSSFASVVVKDCNLRGGNALQWWNPDGGAQHDGAWQAVVGDPTDLSGFPGCISVTLTANSSPSVSQLGGTIFAVANSPAGPSTPATVSLTPASTRISAGDSRTFTATVRDAAGNPIAGQTASFQQTGPASFGGSSTTTGVTGSDGTASVVLSAPLGASGTGSVRVSAGTSAATSAYSVVARPVHSVTTSLSARPTVGRTATLTSVARDDHGRPVSGVPLSVTISGAQRTTGTAVTNAQGVATFAFAAVHAGRIAARVTSSADASVTATTAAVVAKLPARTSLRASSTRRGSVTLVASVGPVNSFTRGDTVHFYAVSGARLTVVGSARVDAHGHATYRWHARSGKSYRITAGIVADPDVSSARARSVTVRVR